MPLYCGKQCVVGCFFRHNKLHAKYLSTSWCLWLCRPTADTCNPAKWKQSWDGGWMTDAHSSWRPCTQALKGWLAGICVWERGEMNQWHAMTCPVAPPRRPEHGQSPLFIPNGWRDGDISVVVHQRYKQCAKHWIIHAPFRNSLLIID